MSKSYEFTSNKNNIYTLLKDMAHNFNCDIASILNFNIHESFVMLDKILTLKDNYSKTVSKLSKITINNFYKKQLKLLYENGKIVLLKKDENKYSSMFLDDVQEELFIPIESKNSSMTFIYLCSLNNKSINIDFVGKDSFIYIIHSIMDIYKIRYVDKKNDTMFEFINMMTRMFKQKGDLVVLHPYNVADISKKIAIQLKLNYDSINKVYFAAILHDIGKLYINRDVFDKQNKQHKLTENEYEIFKQHSMYGYNLLKNIYPDVAIFIKHHHERVDGTGYPDNLKDNQIPLESKIISVANEIDRMYSFRRNSNSKDSEELIVELIHSIDKKFDSRVVDEAIKIILNSKHGNIYKLNNEFEWSTLIIKTHEGLYSINGILRNINYNYIFKSDDLNFLNNINVDDIKFVNLYIYKNMIDIHKYNIYFDFYKENTLRIREINEFVFDDSFNLEWILQAELAFNSLSIGEITICKIGHKSLIFYVPININSSFNKNVFNVNINFKNEDKLTVSGVIIKLFKLGVNYYYELEYVNIPEIIRKKLF
jgi:HD-GYP domain-containing protein (c-di-GMP phosphodiesterase class II)